MSAPNKSDSRAVDISVRIYACLLCMYPGAFRREFGAPMKQVFRDQCRDAWRRSRSLGLGLLWMRALVDLVRTIVTEHISSLREGGGLFGKFANTLRRDTPVRLAFLRVFIGATVAALVWSELLMLWSPRVYSSQVLVRASNPGKDAYFTRTQPKIMESYRLLTNVIVQLRLDEKLAQQANLPRFTMAETYGRLLRLITVKRTRLMDLYEISASSPDPAQAALIANAMAESYHQFEVEEEKRGKTSANVTVLNPARAEQKPTFPNYRAFFRWLTEGTLLAVLGGAAAAVLALRRRPALS